MKVVTICLFLIVFSTLTAQEFKFGKVGTSILEETQDSVFLDIPAKVVYRYINFNYDNELEIHKYVIKVYGRTENNKSVYLKINNYKPYFYIKKPDYWNNDNIKKYINYIFSLFPIEEITNNNSKYVNSKNMYNEQILNGFYKYEIEEHCDLVGFTNYKKFEFIKLSFLSMRTFYAFKKIIKEGKINNKRILKKNYKIQIYESKIKPFLSKNIVFRLL